MKKLFIFGEFLVLIETDSRLMAGNTKVLGQMQQDVCFLERKVILVEGL
jgi:hypothetical protein